MFITRCSGRSKHRPRMNPNRCAPMPDHVRRQSCWRDRLQGAAGAGREEGAAPGIFHFLMFQLLVYGPKLFISRCFPDTLLTQVCICQASVMVALFCLGSHIGFASVSNCCGPAWSGEHAVTPTPLWALLRQPFPCAASLPPLSMSLRLPGMVLDLMRIITIDLPSPGCWGLRSRGWEWGRNQAEGWF